MTRRRGTAVVLPMSAECVCVRVGSIPPVLFCIHAQLSQPLLVVDWTCHDSLVTMVSPTDATQGNCVCSSAPLFLIRFFLFPHLCDSSFFSFSISVASKQGRLELQV
ncbi:hypothetical protein Pelo_10990 [Pelomyxa schiedti]|nr:hypothetical protein Pelo_10990 [Pelomyxa schiedti]